MRCISTNKNYSNINTLDTNAILDINLKCTVEWKNHTVHLLNYTYHLFFFISHLSL